MALTDGLTHWWDLDEESGTRNDSHGTKHLTDRNTVGSVVVGSGRAASFVAANDEQLYSSGITGPSETTPFTMAVRFRIPESSGGGDLFTPGITSNSKLIIAADGRITFNVLHATQTWESYVYADTTPGSWHTVVALFDGTTAYLYIDGVYVSSVAGRRKTGNPKNDRLGIGNCDNVFDAGGVPLQGDIDFVGYWHERALTEEEITALESVTSYADLSGGTPEPVTVSVDYTPIPIQTYDVGITQGQQVSADYTPVPVTTYGAGVEVSPVEIGASFDQVSVTSYGAGVEIGSTIIGATYTEVPVYSYGAGVEISPVQIGASFDQIPVTSYGVDVEIGSTGIGATYTEVPVYSFDASITQGRIVYAAYDEIAVTTYDAAVIPGAIGIGADYTVIPVESFDASITQGVGIGASFDEIPVTSFAASIIQGLRIQAAFTQIEVTSYSAEIVDGSIVRPNRMDCSVRPYYQITASVRPYYDITATVNPAIQ